MKCNSNLHHFSLWACLPKTLHIVSFVSFTLPYALDSKSMYACCMHLLLSKLMLRRSQCEVKWAKGREIRKENWFLTFNCLIVYTHKPSSTILMISNEAVKFCYSLSRLSSTFRTCSRSLVITLYLKYFIIMSIIYLIRSHLFCNEIKEKFL